MSEKDETSIIDELIAEGESQTVDFKRREILSDSTKIAKSIVRNLYIFIKS